MACPVCFTALAFVIVMLLIWKLHGKCGAKSADSSDSSDSGDSSNSDDSGIPKGPTPYVREDPVPEGNEMRPPINGPAFSPYAPVTTARFDERGLLPLPRGGLSCPNKRWYDSVYNGGAETALDAPGISSSDVKTLWEEDADARRREYRVPSKVEQPPAWRNMFV